MTFHCRNRRRLRLAPTCDSLLIRKSATYVAPPSALSPRGQNGRLVLPPVALGLAAEPLPLIVIGPFWLWAVTIIKEVTLYSHLRRNFLVS